MRCSLVLTSSAAKLESTRFAECMSIAKEKFAHFYMQVETIGDAYMIASGLPVVCDDHAMKMAETALAMCYSASLCRSPVDGKPVQACSQFTPFAKFLKYQTLCTDSRWDPQWSSDDRCSGQETASLLPLWRHCEHSEQNGKPWGARARSCLRGD